MKRIVKTALLVFIIAAAAFAAGCSDGSPWQVTSALSPDVTALPQVAKFWADPSTVKAGESTTINWEVVDADEITITSISTGESVSFNVQSKELKGSAPVSNLRSTTEFVLTAVKNAPSEDANAAATDKKAMKAADASSDSDASSSGAATITQTIKVTVEEPVAITAQIAADKSSALPGEQVLLKWTVAPADGVSIKVEADSGEKVVATDKCDGDIGTIISQPALETIPAVGCAVVTPSSSTVYKLTATDAKDATNTKEATADVKVDASGVIADVKVNGERETTITSTESEVEVSWSAKPAGAAVTVTAEPAVVSCTPELPSGKAVEYTSAKCKLSAIPTTFTVVAVMGSVTTEGSKAVVKQGAVDAAISVRADEWAFEGEAVDIKIDLKAGIDPSAIKEIQLSDKVEGIKKITQFPLTAPIKVIAPKDGIRVKMIDSTGAEHDYGTQVRTLTTVADQVDDAVLITKLALDPNDPAKRFTGVMLGGYNAGVVRMFINGSNARDIDIGSQLKAAILGPAEGYWQDSAFDAYVKTFPINAITVRPGDSNKVYMGTTGGVFASADGGKSFTIVAPASFTSKTGSDYSGSHPTCRGKTQTGVKANRKHQLVALNQICDIAVSKGGRLIVATDMGVYSTSNIDLFLQNDPSVLIKGAGSALDMKVVDDVECLDSECMNIVAASSDGVYKSTDGGESWAKFGEVGGRAYSVVALGGQVYAGTDNGVSASDATTASWKSLGLNGIRVLSLAIDPNVGLAGTMLVAGTASGVKVSRDSGASWSMIDAGGNAESLSVAIASSEGSAGKKKVGVTIGSGNSSIHGETEVTKVASGN